MADRFAAGLIWLAVLAVTILFVWLLSDLVIGGMPHLSWTFLVTAPRDAGRAGGGWAGERAATRRETRSRRGSK